MHQSVIRINSFRNQNPRRRLSHHRPAQVQALAQAAPLLAVVAQRPARLQPQDKAQALSAQLDNHSPHHL